MILRHPIGSCHCSVPPPRGAHQSSCRGSSAAWISSPPASKTSTRTRTHARQTCLLCSSKEEEAVRASARVLPCVISVLRLGPQGEEPVVDSTLHREGAVHGGKRPFT